MQQKAHKTIGHVTPQRPMTEQEKQARIMQFLQQKREAFAINILNGLCTNPEAVNKRVVVSGDGQQHTEINKAKNLVALSVEMADDLIGRLYPINEEKKDDSHRD